MLNVTALAPTFEEARAVHMRLATHQLEGKELRHDIIGLKGSSRRPENS